MEGLNKAYEQLRKCKAKVTDSTSLLTRLQSVRDKTLSSAESAELLRMANHLRMISGGDQRMIELTEQLLPREKEEKRPAHASSPHAHVSSPRARSPKNKEGKPTSLKALGFVGKEQAAEKKEAVPSEQGDSSAVQRRSSKETKTDHVGITIPVSPVHARLSVPGAQPQAAPAEPPVSPLSCLAPPEKAEKQPTPEAAAGAEAGAQASGVAGTKEEAQGLLSHRS